MSRVGNQPITVPAGVTIETTDVVVVKGPKGELKQDIINKDLEFSTEGDTFTVTRNNDDKVTKATHGLMRSLIANMIEGVTKGFSKELEVIGVGFKTVVAGKKLTMSLGFSHPIEYTVPEDIDITAEDNVIKISGISKQKVGQVAAEIRAFKKPEPYKGKGIKYSDEVIQRKAGKAAAGGEGA